LHIEPLIPDLCLSGKLCLPLLVLSTLGGDKGFDVSSPSAKKVVLILTTGFCLFVCFCGAKVAIGVHRKSLSHKIDSSLGCDSDV